MKKIIFLLGAPGSGKGLLSNILLPQLNKSGCAYFNPGSIFRQEVKNNSEIGQEVAPFLAAGIMVPLPLITRLFCQYIDSVATDYILVDGYPRDINQWKTVADQLLGHKLLFIWVKTAPKQIIRKIADRRICRDCGRSFDFAKSADCPLCGGAGEIRADDAFIEDRLHLYEQESLPVILHLRRIYWPNFIEIDGYEDESKNLSAVMNKIKSLFA